MIQFTEVTSDRKGWVMASKILMVIEAIQGNFAIIVMDNGDKISTRDSVETILDRIRIVLDENIQKIQGE